MKIFKQIHNWTLFVLIMVICAFCLPLDWLLKTSLGESVFDYTEDMFFEIEAIKND